jgi:hypothetical protein
MRRAEISPKTKAGHTLDRTDKIYVCDYDNPFVLYY